VLGRARTPSSTRSESVTLRIPNEVFSQVLSYATDNTKGNRSEAIVELIEMGLAVAQSQQPTQPGMTNEAAAPSTSEHDEFDQFYADAVATGFLLDIPKNYLPVQGGEFVVKINRPSVYGSWTPMLWDQAKVEYQKQFLISEELE